MHVARISARACTNPLNIKEFFESPMRATCVRIAERIHRTRERERDSHVNVWSLNTYGYIRASCKKRRAKVAKYRVAWCSSMGTATREKSRWAGSENESDIFAGVLDLEFVKRVSISFLPLRRTVEQASILNVSRVQWVSKALQSHGEEDTILKNRKIEPKAGISEYGSSNVENGFEWIIKLAIVQYSISNWFTQWDSNFCFIVERWSKNISMVLRAKRKKKTRSFMTKELNREIVERKQKWQEWKWKVLILKLKLYKLSDVEQTNEMMTPTCIYFVDLLHEQSDVVQAGERSL